MSTEIKILMIEDHPGYREVIEMALQRQKHFNVIAQFGTAERAIQSLEESLRSSLPDIVLLDLNLPKLQGLDAIQPIHKWAPEAKIIVLTQSDREEDVLKAIMLGASGYVLKSTTVTQLNDSINNVYNGGASLDANVAILVLTTLKSKLPKEEIEIMLSKRELETLKLLAEGFAKKEIADQMGIGVTTVVTHVTHIYEKLNVRNAPEAVSKAIKLGILNID